MPERLQRHNLPNNGVCALCVQADEAIPYVLLTCVFSRLCLQA
jgi:hypothetical protein